MVDKVCDNCMNLVPIDAENCPKCGIRFENTNPGGALPNGWVLGQRYTVGRYLDIDGEGVIYSAIDAHSLERVTIKEFMPVTLCAKREEDGSIVSKPGCEVLFKTTRMDYADLYQGLLSLGETEGLLSVLDVFEENNTAYAVTEKIEGPTLSEYLTRMEIPLEYTRVMQLLLPIMSGVETMHAANIIHRGICPDNIILQSGGTAKLGGYATLALRQQGSELKPKLYPGYSAPEQYSASEFEGRYTDIYAIAAVIFRMITGLDPKPADDRKIQDTIRGVRSYSKEIPTYFSLGLLQAMRVLPAERFQTMGEFQDALSGEGDSAVAGLFGLTRKQLIIAASALGVILLTCIILLFVFLFSGKDNTSSSDTTSESESISDSSSDTSDEVKGVPTPTFVNKKLTDVIGNREYEDFIFAEPEEVFDEKVEKGVIIDQTPKAGEVWDEETPIKLIVSKGKELIEMPDVVGDMGIDGFSETEAKNKLTELGFTNINVVTEDNKGEYLQGTVIRQDPAPGSKIGPAAKITIYVAGKVTTVKMPNLLGMTESEAKQKLDSLGIKYTESVMVENDGRYKPKTIVKTSIAADSDVNAANDRVTLDVANDVLMPNVIGMTLEQVDSEFKRLEGTVSGVKLTTYVVDELSTTAKAGTVVRTNKDGQTVKDGEQVIIYRAKAPDPTPTPVPTPEVTPSPVPTDSTQGDAP